MMAGPSACGAPVRLEVSASPPRTQRASERVPARNCRLRARRLLGRQLLDCAARASEGRFAEMPERLRFPLNGAWRLSAEDARDALRLKMRETPVSSRCSQHVSRAARVYRVEASPMPKYFQSDA